MDGKPAWGRRLDGRDRVDAGWPAVIVTTIDGMVTHWSPAAERLYGWAPAETHGKSIMDININAPDVEPAAEIMARLATGRTWEGRFRVRHKDGTTFMAWVADAPLLDAEGNTVGVIGLSVPADDMEDRIPGPGRLPQPRQLVWAAQPDGSSSPLGVAVVGEAGLRAHLEAMVRRHPERLQLDESSPSVLLVAAGPTAAYDVSVVSSLSAAGRRRPALIAIGNPTPDHVVLECVRRDFRGYLTPNVTDSELVRAIERAAAGELVIDNAVATETLRRAALLELAHPHIVNRWDLRPREIEVLTWLVSGMSNRHIARHMSIGEETVKTHLKSVYRKLGVRDRASAVATALGYPLHSDDPDAKPASGNASGAARRM